MSELKAAEQTRPPVRINKEKGVIILAAECRARKGADLHKLKPKLGIRLHTTIRTGFTTQHIHVPPNSQNFPLYIPLPNVKSTVILLFL